MAKRTVVQNINILYHEYCNKEAANLMKKYERIMIMKHAHKNTQSDDI